MSVNGVGYTQEPIPSGEVIMWKWTATKKHADYIHAAVSARPDRRP